MAYFSRRAFETRKGTIDRNRVINGTGDFAPVKCSALPSWLQKFIEMKPTGLEKQAYLKKVPLGPLSVSPMVSEAFAAGPLYCWNV